MPEESGAFRTSDYIHSYSWNWNLSGLNQFEIAALKRDVLKFAESSSPAITLISNAVRDHDDLARNGERPDPNVLVLYEMFAPALANGNLRESATLNEMLSIIQLVPTDHRFASKSSAYSAVARALQSVHERMRSDNGLLSFPKRQEQQRQAPPIPYRLAVGSVV